MLYKLILVLPAINIIERSFSLMRLENVYLRATTGQGRLNHLINLSECKENLNKSNLKDVARNLST